MNKSDSDRALELQKAWDAGEYTTYLTALEDYASGSAPLDNEMRTIVLTPILNSMKTSGQHWRDRIYMCAVASKAAKAVSKWHEDLADHLKGAADKARLAALDGCSPVESKIIQDLVFSLERVRSEASFQKFDFFLQDLAREETVWAGASAGSSSDAFQHHLKELRHSSDRVFSALLQRLTSEEAGDLKYRLDLLGALPEDQKERLRGKIERLDQERILNELAIDEFDQLSASNEGVKAVRTLKESLDGKLFKVSLQPHRDANGPVRELSKKAISAIKALDEQLGNTLPEYSWEKLERAFGLGGLLTSMEDWLKEQASKSDCGILEQALSMVSAWTECRLAGRPLVSQQAHAELVKVARTEYEEKLLLRARGLLKDADKWQADHRSEWEDVKSGCSGIESSRDEKEWAVWHLVNEVLGMVHSEPRRHQEILGLLREGSFTSRSGKHKTADLIKALKSVSTSRHVRMLAGIFDILQKSKDQPEAAVTSELRVLMDGDESVFMGLLESYTNGIQEINIWQKLAGAECRTDIDEIRTEVGEPSGTEPTHLQRALDHADVIINQGDRLLDSPETYFEAYSCLTRTLKDRGLAATSSYQEALANFIERLCTRKEKDWEKSAREGDPVSIRNSFCQLNMTVPWSEHAANERIDARRTANQREYSKLGTDASVRHFIANQQPLKAVKLALSEKGYHPGNDMREMLREAVSQVAAKNLSAKHLQKLLAWDMDWDDKSLRAIVDGCFRRSDGELLSDLNKIRGSLPGDYDQLLDWHTWREKRDRHLLEALSTNGEISNVLKETVLGFLHDTGVPLPTICLVWESFAGKLGLGEDQLTRVRASLRARDAALQSVRESLGNLRGLFGLAVIPHIYSASHVENLVSSIKAERDSMVSTFEEWREGADQSISELSDEIKELDKAIGFLEPRWKRMIRMLSEGDPDKWPQLCQEVKNYSIGPDGGSVLVSETLVMLQRVLSRCEGPSDRIDALRRWFDGNSDTEIPQDRVDALKADFENEPDLLKGHSKAKGNLKGFIADMEETADRLRRWEEHDVSFNNHRISLSEYAEHGTGRVSEVTDIINWYDEMKEMAGNATYPGVLRAWFQNWERTSGRDCDEIMRKLRERKNGANP